MIALARDFDFFATGELTTLSAIFLPICYVALAGDMCAFLSFFPLHYVISSQIG